MSLSIHISELITHWAILTRSASIDIFVIIIIIIIIVIYDSNTTIIITVRFAIDIFIMTCIAFDCRWCISSSISISFVSIIF